MDYHIDGGEPEVAKAILHLFKNELFTDVTVNCKPGNEKFRVHKLILALYSPVLCDKFYGTSKCDTVNIEGSELSAVENMIKFCYGEQLAFNNISDIQETKLIAEKYKIVELLNICIKEIDSVNVDTSNVLTVLEMSVQCGNRNKENECFEVISRNREIVFASEQFLKMKFETVSHIFEKLREMGFFTEEQYIRSAIEWIRCGDNKSKEILKERIEITKLSMDGFLDIVVSFPNFFTNIEIAKALKKIKKAIKDTSPNEQSDTLTKSGSTVQVKGVCDPSNVQTSKMANLTISILDGKDGNEDVKQAIITIEDGNSRRGLNFYIAEDLKDGLFLQLLSLGNGDYVFNNMNVTYDGIYFMVMYLKSMKQISLSPLNYTEILKAAFGLGLRKVQESCLEKLNNIIDFDPAFLEALLVYPNFLEKIKSLIIQNTMGIIMHPNFLDCSVTLIKLILTQTKLSVASEMQLLLVTIAWLEARNRLRWDLRSSILNGIAFENVNHSDLEYISKRYPKFFTKDEMDSILLYKLSNNSENTKSLPKWYNFKPREYQMD